MPGAQRNAEYPYHTQLKCGSRFASVIHPRNDDVYLIWQSSDGKIQVTRYLDGKHSTTLTVVESGKCLNGTPLAACSWATIDFVNGFIVHVFYLTPEYKLANVWLLDYQGLHVNPDSLEGQNITAHGDSDIAAVSWGSGAHMRVWYQAPETLINSSRRCQIKELEHNRTGDTWKHNFTFGQSNQQRWFIPLPGTRLAATNRGTESSPKLDLFAQEATGGIVHFSSTDTKWTGYETPIRADGCRLYTPITCASWRDSDRELVNMFYISDTAHIVDWRCLYKDGNQSNCAHPLLHELGPKAEMSLCGVKDLKFIGEPKA